ncbi:four helix bundle protein [Patescibacteria group bacterium]|nr:four helix bundle protein [Patescibacteria group bacterium]
MAGNPILRQKAFTFALSTVTFCKKLNENREYVLSNQLLKSGTSIGANIEEAQQAESRKDFISKYSISLKEAYETRYWLRLIGKGVEGTEEVTAKLLSDVDEIIRILVVSIKSLKAGLKK